MKYTYLTVFSMLIF